MSINSTALSRLLLAERRSLLRQVSRLVGRDSAEDVAQKLWLKIQAVRRLAHNVAVDHIKGDQRKTGVAQHVEALLWEQDQEPGPDRIVESRETLQRVRDALANLPEPTRIILHLTRIEGLTQRETAERVGVSSTTVENHLRRAMAKLARIRDGDPDEK
mgnify:CR=1 FL=1